MLNINAVKGFQIGSGFDAALLRGSSHNDLFVVDNENIRTKTNFSGGVQGGITNGMDIVFKVAFKPVATILKPQKTIDTELNNIEINLPFVYKDNFSKTLNFFESNDLKYNLEFELERFKPIFINSNFEEMEYGKSEKVLITGLKQDEFLIDELNYIIENTKHAKTVLIDKNHKTYLEEKFNFAVLIDFEVELKQKKHKGLFDD